MDEVIFTGPLDREARVSADRQRITHRAGAWSTGLHPRGADTLDRVLRAEGRV